MAKTGQRKFFRPRSATEGSLGLKEKDGPACLRDGYCRCQSVGTRADNHGIVF
jgi:hypothetical protein